MLSTYEDIDTSGIPAPEPFRAPKFQGNYTHGTYVETRWPQFKVHESLGHAKRSLTMTNSRLWDGSTQALANSAIYTRLDHHDGTTEWVPADVYPAGAELPWRSRSAR